MNDLMISEPSYAEVDACHSSNQGENLLHGYGIETNQLDPEHYFIPWITFDNVRKNYPFLKAFEEGEFAQKGKKTITHFAPFHFHEIFRSMKMEHKMHFMEKSKYCQVFSKFCPASFSRDFSRFEN